jgi:phenylpropionate dioxygenase-like ring-hydroxylating dioxygenase large terminal subunit
LPVLVIDVHLPTLDVAARERERCRDLDAYFDGALESAPRERFERHLLGCAPCQAGLEDELQLLAAGVELAGLAHGGWKKPRGRRHRRVLQHAAQEQLIRRILTHLHDGTTDAAAGSHRQPAADYHCPQHHRRELEHVLRRQPLLVCHASRVAEPGAYVALDVAGLPVIVARTRDGRLGALLNVCRHRGARLVAAGQGRAKCFACPYHAWTYDTGGRLLHIPHDNGFDDLTTDLDTGRDLVSIPVAERFGGIWICGDRSALLDVDAHLGALGPELDALALDRHHVHEEYEQLTAMNWKLVIDGFLEAYHIRSTHRDSFYRAVFDNLALHDHVGRHSRSIYPLRKIRALEGHDAASWDLRRVASLIYHLFPNTIIAVEPYHVTVFHVEPLDAGRSRIRATVLVDPDRVAHDRDKVRKDIALLKAGLVEDYAIGESIQAGLVAGANDHFLFGRFEGTLAHFHRSLAEVLGAA